MRELSRRALLAGAVLVGAALARAADPCLRTRAAFDVGSGTTRMVVAEVDVCSATARVLLERQERVGYAEDLARSATNSLSDEIRASGLAVLQAMAKQAAPHKPQAHAGAATAAFRRAANARDFLDEIRLKAGISLRVVSQDEEALLGYRAARIAAPEVKDPVVWDIGAASMQLSAQDGKRHLIGNLDLAAVTFKDRVIAEIQRRKGASSPNPLSRKEADAAVALAERAAAGLPAELRKRLAAGAAVVGVGGVHRHSVRAQTGGGEAYTRAQVAAALQKRIGQTDKDIGGRYPETEATNLALVLGFMNALRVDSVRPAQADNGVAVLLDPGFW